VNTYMVFLGVLLCRNQFTRPQVGQITQIYFTKMQNDQNYPIFYLFS